MAKRPPKSKLTTPAQDGYSFPAEWERHRGTWLSWPRPEGISFPDKYHTVPRNIAAIVNQIQQREQVHINVPNGNVERIVRAELKRYRCPADNVHFHHIKTNECWCRDHGPAFVLKKLRSGRVDARIVDFGFNAWGGKYPPYDDDDRVPSEVAAELGLPVYHTDIVMEGGGIDVNGAGTLLTTESCLLNPNRNPGMSKRDIERFLCDYYGQSHICWLGEGIVGDDTDGHIDDLARFINPTTIVTGVETDPRDANFKILRENRRRLELLRDQEGRPFNIVEIPMPGVVKHNGERLPATYVNFYFVNDALLVPTFGDKRRDREALATLAKALLGRKVIGIDCRELVWGLGAIHCLTQQIPEYG